MIFGGVGVVEGGDAELDGETVRAVPNAGRESLEVDNVAEHPDGKKVTRGIRTRGQACVRVRPRAPQCAHAPRLSRRAHARILVLI